MHAPRIYHKKYTMGFYKLKTICMVSFADDTRLYYCCKWVGWIGKKVLNTGTVFSGL